MTTPRVSWGTAGILAGLAGLAVSHAATRLLGVRLTPMEAVAELVIGHTPGPVAHWVIDLIGTKDKPLLLLIVTLGMLAFMLGPAGWPRSPGGRRSWSICSWAAVACYAVLSTGTTERAIAFVPVVAGVVTWIVTLSFLTEPMHRDAVRPHRPAHRGRARPGAAC